MQLTTSFGHRGGLLADARQMYPEPWLFDRLGGAGHIQRIAGAFYDRCEADPQLSPLFPHFNRKAFALFLQEWSGGPTRYSSDETMSQLRRHFRLGITSSLAQRWLAHLEAACHACHVSNETTAEMLDVLTPVAHGLINDAEGGPGRLAMHPNCSGRRVRGTPADLAARGETAGLLTLLDTQPALVQLRGPAGRTLLWEAAFRGQRETVEQLLERGAAVDVCGATPAGSRGYCTLAMVTPFCAARARGHDAVAEVLAGHGARMDVFTAAYLGHLDVLSELLRQDAGLAVADDPADDFLRIQPLHHAVCGGHLDAMHCLLAAGAGVAEHGRWLLSFAVHRQRLDIVHVLVDHGARAEDAPHLGDYHGRGREVAEVLVAAGFDIDRSGLLLRACRADVSTDDPARVDTLLSLGADVNVRGDYERCALHWAAKGNLVRVAQRLIEKGAAVDARDELGQTPLIHLFTGRSKRDGVEMMQALVAGGANIDGADHRGDTALFHAVRRGNTAAVRWLLEQGADTARCNARGQTAAELAAGLRHARAAEVRALFGA